MIALCQQPRAYYRLELLITTRFTQFLLYFTHDALLLPLQVAMMPSSPAGAIPAAKLTQMHTSLRKQQALITDSLRRLQLLDDQVKQQGDQLAQQALVQRLVLPAPEA